MKYILVLSALLMHISCGEKTSEKTIYQNPPINKSIDIDGIWAATRFICIEDNKIETVSIDLKSHPNLNGDMFLTYIYNGYANTTFIKSFPSGDYCSIYTLTKTTPVITNNDSIDFQSNNIEGFYSSTGGAICDVIYSTPYTLHTNSFNFINLYMIGNNVTYLDSQTTRRIITNSTSHQNVRCYIEFKKIEDY